MQPGGADRAPSGGRLRYNSLRGDSARGDEMQRTQHWLGLVPLGWAGAARRAAPPALLLCIVVPTYAPAVPNLFVSDDLDRLAGDAADLFSPASGFGRFMPLAAGVHRATATLSGLDPVPAHTFQLALHAACTLLVYALARALGADRAVALAAAVLFALYPRQHQVVMWFGAVSLGLGAAVSLAAAWCFVRAWRDPGARIGWATVACYAATLLSHESAVALPLVFATLALFESRRLGRGLPRPLPPWLWAGAAVLVAHLGLLAWAYRVRAAAYPDSGYRFLGLGG